MGAEHSSSVSTCFYGVYKETYPVDEVNYYYYGWGTGDAATDSKFCERWANPVHEYFNSFSALFISFVGIYQLTWDHNYGILRFLGGCFFVNGIGSFLNHWFATRDWDIIDGSSMYIPAWVLMSGIAENLYAISNNAENAVYRPLVKALIWGVSAIVIWALIYNDMNGCGTDIGALLFPIGFAIPPLTVAGLGIAWIPYAYKIIDTRYKDNDKQFGHRFEKSVVYFSWGIALSIIGAISWILIESILCKVVDDKYKPILGWIPAHAVWHILESYGLSLMMIFFVSLSSVRNQLRIEWRFPELKKIPNRAPSFAIKSTKSRIISTKNCCCKAVRSQVCDEILNILLPVPTTEITNAKHPLIHKRPQFIPNSSSRCTCCTVYLQSLDGTCVTRKGGFCRCWVACAEKCCCSVHHYPVGEEIDFQVEDGHKDDKKDNDNVVSDSNGDDNNELELQVKDDNNNNNNNDDDDVNNTTTNTDKADNDI